VALNLLLPQVLHRLEGEVNQDAEIMKDPLGEMKMLLQPMEYLGQ
jgi:hypothetical protein